MILWRKSCSGVIKLEIIPEPAFSILVLPSFEIPDRKSFYPVRKDTFRKAGSLPQGLESPFLALPRPLQYTRCVIIHFLSEVFDF
jgi:hypothetical protein